MKAKQQRAKNAIVPFPSNLSLLQILSEKLCFDSYVSSTSCACGGEFLSRSIAVAFACAMHFRIRTTFVLCLQHARLCCITLSEQQADSSCANVRCMLCVRSVCRLLWPNDSSVGTASTTFWCLFSSFRNVNPIRRVFRSFSGASRINSKIKQKERNRRFFWFIHSLVCC